MSSSTSVFQFVPNSSFVHPSFWHKLTELKLNVDRLSTDRRTIRGFYNNSNSVQALHEVDCTGFNEGTGGGAKPGILPTHGVLLNKNTIEDFKREDKVRLLNVEGQRIWAQMASGEGLADPSRLAPFVLLTFADLKKHYFYYWFAFPTVAQPVATPITSTPANQLFSDDAIAAITEAYFGCPEAAHRSFFVLQATASGRFEHRKLSELISCEDRQANFADGTDDLYFAFSDPSSDENAGWPARLFMVQLMLLCPRLRGQQIRLLAVRCKNNVSIEPSVVFTVRLLDEPVDEPSWSTAYIGWEHDEQGTMRPRLANMAKSMDPERLAKTSVSLNLKLMKWRLMPTLDLDRIADTKCLLLGAGTLGCTVARNLLAWGVKHISFVDSGKVSYSNPVRQNLFVFDDAIRGREKAPAAAVRLAEVCPGLQTAGHNMHIPMPGHPVGAAAELQRRCREDIATLESLVEAHDAIFLLTDSRESRWLPTLLGAAANKIVLNAALGFDTYLVMRHGSRRDETVAAAGAAAAPSDAAAGSSSGGSGNAEPAQSDKAAGGSSGGSGGSGDVKRPVAGGSGSAAPVSVPSGLRSIDGGQLGCYFCNDITAPGNSLKDRTLDQQCTVTRPGVANIAGAMVAELLVSVLQHERRELAPAYVSCRTQPAASGDAARSATGDTAPRVPEGLLGIIPHSIRGQLSSYEHILPATERYAHCIACSEKVLAEYREHRVDFLFKVFDSAKYLEDLCGIGEAFHYDDNDQLFEMGDSDGSDDEQPQ